MCRCRTHRHTHTSSHVHPCECLSPRTLSNTWSSGLSSLHIWSLAIPYIHSSLPQLPLQPGSATLTLPNTFPGLAEQAGTPESQSVGFCAYGQTNVPRTQLPVPTLSAPHQPSLNHVGTDVLFVAFGECALYMILNY